jgi:hypothetical protein
MLEFLIYISFFFFTSSLVATLAQFKCGEGENLKFKSQPLQLCFVATSWAIFTELIYLSFNLKIFNVDSWMSFSIKKKSFRVRLD